ncbi:MAG: hypothetical protein US53_C0022G0004 [Candidatus Woesebacteria bacterium GW2011_GWA1_37_7]|uniref:Glycosyltransferase RgtA/B/C/D-like domain-containing protein n=1 Tax=Candidatus Woesebacteria bacterium GW2011_GWA1_37_7 TaxID=1618545 RepID=A0A0G0JKL8_9BACT|nr:MAG: hypothetical protein US53_C0022G0004 [Candidatus Woesebacteria bacterium GW2011_GWA1_37_7]
MSGIFVLIIIFCLFVVRGLLFLDPDFGFHIRMGQIITQSGIPKTDPFSYSMPSFPYIDHEWLTNIFIYKIYENFGINILYLLSALIVITTVFIASRNFSRIIIRRNSIIIYDLLHEHIGQNTNYLNVVILLTFAVLFSFAGVRPQIISWFFFTLLTRLIFDPLLWRKWKFSAPIIILLWSNFHGSYAIGLAVLSMTFIIRSLMRKGVDFQEVAILVLSVISTFLNPYGPRLWNEVFTTISDSNLRWSIAEWMPTILFFHLPLILLFTISTLLIYRYRRFYSLEELILYLFLLFQALSSRRHLPFWIIYSLPLTIFALEKFYDEVRTIKYGIERFRKLYISGFYFVVILIFLQIFFDVRGASALREENYYPVKAINYLKNDLPGGEILSIYNWGGYLIWKLPEKKVFIDGRMPSWRWNAPDSEADWAFKEYNQLFKGKVERDILFTKYNIDTILLDKRRKETILDRFSDLLNEFLTRMYLAKREVDFKDKLLNEGWQVVYEDEISIIYSKE